MNYKPHLYLISSIFIFSLFLYLAAINKPDIRSLETQYAATCQTPFTITPVNGHIFTGKCLQPGIQIYSDDTRFKFTQIPSELTNATYVQTENAALKDQPGIQWNINLTSPAQIYILTRYTPNSAAPSWISSAYDQLTSSHPNPQDLTPYLLRSSTINPTRRGIYQIWQRKNGVASGLINFQSAFDSGQKAYSMYIVAAKPVISNTPAPSATAAQTAPPTAAPTATSPSTGNNYPAQVLNLTNWKVTLPTGSAGKPTEILQPQLNTFKLDPWFIVNPTGGVRFRSPVNGVTTSGSSYPRSELREMSNNGSTNASWSSASGTHTLTIAQTVTALPKVKQHLVVGQIHDANDDVTVFRVEGTALYITDGNTTHAYTVDSNFSLNKRFTVKFEVSSGIVKYYYNGNLLPYTQHKNFSGAYFKAGAYTQANCSNSSPCTSDNYGETIIHDLQVSHQ